MGHESQTRMYPQIIAQNGVGRKGKSITSESKLS